MTNKEKLMGLLFECPYLNEHDYEQIVLTSNYLISNGVVVVNTEDTREDNV